MFKTTLEKYFNEDCSELLWIRYPFISDDIPGTLTNNVKEFSIELSCDGCSKIKFTK